MDLARRCSFAYIWRVTQPNHDQSLKHLIDGEFLSPDPEAQADLERRIDLYFNTPLEIFPFSETRRKPKRFYDFNEGVIAERFPDDQDIRDWVSLFTREFFGALGRYVLVKRLVALVSLGVIGALMLLGPGLMARGQSDPWVEVLATMFAMAVVYGVYFGVSALIYSQYKISLENRSYALSRLITQRSQELQRLFTQVKALPDQAETKFGNDGVSWGERSSYLVRLLMWVAARMEYLEKFIQVEMWRVRRERYWLNWLALVLVGLIILGWIGWVATASFIWGPAPVEGEMPARVLQGFALVLGLWLAVSSYFLWQTPLNLVRDTLESDSWIRFADLDLDNAIGDQVRRDKERLVEYRSVNKAGH